MTEEAKNRISPFLSAMLLSAKLTEEDENACN